MATDNIVIRISKNDALLLQLKTLTKQNNRSFASMVKYVLACSILNQPLNYIAKVCISDLEAINTRESNVVPIRISDNDYNGMLLSWLSSIKKDTSIKVSQYVKYMLMECIETCNTQAEQKLYNTYKDELRINKLSKLYDVTNTDTYTIPLTNTNVEQHSSSQTVEQVNIQQQKKQTMNVLEENTDEITNVPVENDRKTNIDVLEQMPKKEKSIISEDEQKKDILSGFIHSFK